MSSFKCLHKNCSVSYSDYTFVRNIGSGAQGGTSLRRDKEGRLFCFKKSFVNENDIIPEAHFLFNEFNSPFLVKIHHCFIGEGEMIQVMDYCAGGSLADLVNSKVSFSKQDLFMILTQVSHGLRFLHSKNIIHRDVKPENIVLESKERPFRLKICDFGISKVLQSTFTGSMLGTMHFMAPEILNQQPYSTAVDMWALGVLMFFLIKGEYPFNTFDEIKSGQLPQFDCDFGVVLTSLLVRDVNQRASALDIVALPAVSFIYEEYFRECSVEEVIEMKRNLKTLSGVVESQVGSITQLLSSVSEQSNLIEKLTSTVHSCSETITEQQSTIQELLNQVKNLKTRNKQTFNPNHSSSSLDSSLVSQLLSAVQNTSSVAINSSTPSISSNDSIFNPPLFHCIQNSLGVEVLELDKLIEVEQLRVPKSTFLYGIDGIQLLKNLECLSFEYDVETFVNFDASSLTPLSKLQHLRVLKLYVPIEDVSAVGQLTSLESLELIGNANITNIKPISNLLGLSFLKLSLFPLLTSLTPLSNLQIKRLELIGLDKLQSLRPLGFLQYLEELLIDSCSSLQDTSFLSTVSSLHTMVLSNLSALSSVCAHENLVQLKISNCENLRGQICASGLRNLKLFELENCNSLNCTRFLTDFPSISVVKLISCNRIYQIPLSSTASSLKELLISGSHTMAFNLEKLPCLEVLSVVNNVSSMNLSCLPSLKNLKLNNVPNSMILSKFSHVFDFEFKRTSQSKLSYEESSVAMFSLVSYFSEISIKNCLGFEHFDFSDCQQLKTLTIENTKSSQETSLIPPESIEKLVVNNLEGVSQAKLTALNLLASVDFSHCPMITMLEMCDCQTLSEVKVSKMNGLTSFSLQGLELLSTVALTCCDNLISVSLSNLSTFSSLSLSNLPLQTLSVADCSELSTVVLNTFDRLSNLNLSNLTKLSSISLSNLSNLEVLDLNECVNLSKLDLTICDKLNNLILSNLVNLSSISLSNLPKVEVLALNECSGLNKVVLNNLEILTNIVLGSNLSKLRSFSASNCPKLSSLLDFSTAVSLSSFHCDGSLVNFTGLDSCSVLQNMSGISSKNIVGTFNFGSLPIIYTLTISRLTPTHLTDSSLFSRLNTLVIGTVDGSISRLDLSNAPLSVLEVSDVLELVLPSRSNLNTVKLANIQQLTGPFTWSYASSVILSNVDQFDVSGLKNIKTLKLDNVKNLLNFDRCIEVPALTHLSLKNLSLNVSRSSDCAIGLLYFMTSSYTNPSSSPHDKTPRRKYVNNLSKFELISVSGLTGLDLSGCKSLTSIHLETLPQLKSITWPQEGNPTNIVVKNLNSFTSFDPPQRINPTAKIEVSNLSSCTYFSLTPIPDTVSLSVSNLNKLRHIFLNDNDFYDLSPFASVSSIKELTCSTVKNLKGLESLRSLEKISCGLSNLSPLSSLVHLRDVNIQLDSSPPSDYLYPLSPCINIEKLQIYSTKTPVTITIDPLASLINLQELSFKSVTIRCTNPDEFSKLARLTNLQSSNSHLDGRYISHLVGLTHLSLYEVSCALDFLSNLRNLSYLYIQPLLVDVNSFAPLSNLINLEQLSIVFTRSHPTDVSPLRTLTKLKSVYFRDKIGSRVLYNEILRAFPKISFR
ncbi:hypothetical protein RCL1_003299 [Eukaryota sp. TZLM3-RCL]